MTTYVTELAQDFSAFYRDCKVVGAAEEGGDEDLRIALSEATRRTIERSLDLLGVSAARCDREAAKPPVSAPGWRHSQSAAMDGRKSYSRARNSRVCHGLQFPK